MVSCFQHSNPNSRYPELADKLLRYADREPPKPDIPASEWIKRPSVGR